MGVMRLCFLLFCLFWLGNSFIRELNSIAGLKNTGYASSAPRIGRQILFWLAGQVNVDQNNNIIHSNFNPRRGDYGFHRFQNRELILPSLDPGHSYYEVGNLNPNRYPGAGELPPYVRRFYRNTDLPERNMDRLIVSLNRQHFISRVFITAHNRNGNDFNPYETFEIILDLIEQIRQMYFCNSLQSHNEDQQCNAFLQETGYNNDSCLCRDLMDRSSYFQCNALEGIKLEIKTTDTGGYAKIIWENIPADTMKTYQYMYIDFSQNTYSKDTDTDVQRLFWKDYRIFKSSGALDTSVSINAGLQPRLRLYKSYLSSPVIWNGPEFDGANRVLPIRIKGCDASLQLYAKDGKASARLYIKKTFSDWNNVFYYSWVGFYKSSLDNNNHYYTYKYAVYFKIIDNTTIEDYDIYQYDSSLTIAPGVQIRFLLDKSYDKVLAQTTPWGGDEQLTMLPSNCNPRPDPSSSWSFPEFFNEPEFYDANNVVPVKIKGYDAGLQLFTKDGKVCARLYIKKSFGNWKKNFYYSWVGFYSNSQKKNTSYQTYQWAVYFKKTDDTENFHIYQYKSSLTIAPGVQIRFFKDKRYDHKLVETEPWSN